MNTISCFRACLAILVFGATACTSLRTVDQPAVDPERKVQVGDTVRIVTRDGQELDLLVVALDRDALVGERRPDADPAVGGREGVARGEGPESTVRVPFDEIALVQVREFDGWRTAALVGSTVATAWLIGILLASVLVVPVM